LRDFTLDNELRYLSIADEALRQGTFFTFSNHGIPYADKPPLYFWIVMAGKMLFGYHNMLFLSLFSFIPALIIIHLMGQWVKPLLSKIERLMAELLLLTSSFYIGTAIVLRMDMLMTMFIVLSLHTFFKMYNGQAKSRDSFLFPIFVFMAIFSKGPMGLIVPLISTAVFPFIKKEIR
jgi:4-amino-4-deoxy-L-arabinose transferase-like glycosyltransferase